MLLFGPKILGRLLSRYLDARAVPADQLDGSGTVVEVGARDVVKDEALDDRHLDLVAVFVAQRELAHLWAGSTTRLDESDCAAILLRMTLLRPRVDALLRVPAVAPRPPLVHVPA